MAMGRGLHTGKLISMKVCPAEPDTGLVFRRIDLSPVVDIPATARNVVDTSLSTTIGIHDQPENRVGTVEHFISACAGLGIDNVVIELDGPEVPIMDGSAADFVFFLQAAGFRYQDKPKKFIRITRELKSSHADSWALIRPHDGFRVSYTMEYNHPVIKRYNSKVEVDFSTTSYIKEVSRARTFGLVHELEALQKNNLALGASTANAIAVDDDGIQNPEGLRSGRELVMHKVLDAIGDLYLLGYPLIGEFQGFKSGHTLNNKLLFQLLEEESYEIVTFKNEDCPISLIPRLYKFMPASVGEMAGASA